MSIHIREPAPGPARVPVLLSLGSNIDAEHHLRQALLELEAAFGPLRASPGYRNPAIGFDGAPFINSAVLMHTVLALPALECWLQGLEDRHGRDRALKGLADRTLDLDVVFYADRLVYRDGQLRVPRPERAHAFVLKPLADIAPEFIDPADGRSLGQLWSLHPDAGTHYEAVPLRG